MIFKPTKNTPYNPHVCIKINNIPIKRVSCCVFLGVNFDETLSFKIHCQAVRIKLSKIMYLLRKVKNILPVWSLKMLYFSYIHSILTYCFICWGPLLNKKHFNSLEKLQRKIIRIITNSSYNAHTADLFQKLQIMKINNLLGFPSKLLFLHSHNMLPYNLNELFTRNNASHNYNTRNKNYASIDKHTTKVFHSSFLCAAPSFWGQLPVNLKTNSKDKEIFKKNLKKHLLSNQ